MVKTRYKQSNVGKIPIDWGTQKIEEYTYCRAGGTPSTSVSEYWGGDILWMSSGELHLKRVNDVEKRITKKGLQESSAHVFPSGCVLIGLAGQGKTRGTVAVNNVELTTNQSIAAVYPSNKHVTEFLYYSLESRYDELRSMSTGDGGRGGLNLKIINSVEIPFPPKDEQKLIARVLIDIDELINSIDKLLSKKQNIRITTMQQLLTGKMRLESFGNGKGFNQTELGMVPEDWVIAPLGELGEFINGINKDADEFGHGSPFVNLNDVFQNESIENSNEFGLINSSIGERKSYNLEAGDVLFVRSSVKPSGVGLSTLIESNLEDTVFSGFLIRFRCDSTLKHAFKKFCFLEDKFRKRLIEFSTVSANTNINQQALKKLQIAFPLIQEEQQKIAEVLTDMGSEIIELGIKLSKLKDIKHGLMQELLIGRTRLI